MTDDKGGTMKKEPKERDTWNAYPDPFDPDNFWINEETGERVRAI